MFCSGLFLGTAVPVFDLCRGIHPPRPRTISPRFATAAITPATASVATTPAAAGEQDEEAAAFNSSDDCTAATTYALLGVDLVSYATLAAGDEPAIGSTHYASSYGGYSYLFSSASNKALFEVQYVYQYRERSATVFGSACSENHTRDHRTVEGRKTRRKGTDGEAVVVLRRTINRDRHREGERCLQPGTGVDKIRLPENFACWRRRLRLGKYVGQLLELFVCSSAAEG